MREASAIMASLPESVLQGYQISRPVTVANTSARDLRTAALAQLDSDGDSVAQQSDNRGDDYDSPVRQSMAEENQRNFM